MKVGIISDIHANLAALRTVVARGRAESCAQWLFLGDLVGYYYQPAACLALIRDIGTICIAGNHDRMLTANAGAMTKLTAKYGHGHATALGELSQSDLQWLRDLPDQRELELDGRRVLMCHGTPWQADEYAYPDAPESVWTRMAQTDASELILFGHTHYPVLRSVQGTTLLNPGSVGQPRNGQPGAHWALWDTQSNLITLHIEAYDPSALIAEAKTMDPDIPYLHEVLVRRGRRADEI